MKRTLSVTTASKSSPLIVDSGFSGYDHALNTYVGCEFGCQFCYVRWFVTDADHPWGEFIRLRKHVATRLPLELNKIGPTRLVLGTMTDPFQPQELKARLTRMALQMILKTQRPMKKVGIFTRSPRVMDDIELIKQLPRGRVHVTISPFPRDVQVLLEPIPVSNEARFQTVEALRAAGIRVHVSIAPVLPIVSEPLTTEFVERLAKIGVDEFFVDPIQPYGTSLTAMRQAMVGYAGWQAIDDLITDKASYQLWKAAYAQSWYDAWAKVKSTNPKTLPIMMNHVTHTRIDMRSKVAMDWKLYGDDLE